MKKKIIMILGLLTIASARVFAEDPKPDSNLTPDQVEARAQRQKAIATLLSEGVIEWVDGHFIVKNPSALDELRRRGRVDLLDAYASVVCY